MWVLSLLNQNRSLSVKGGPTTLSITWSIQPKALLFSSLQKMKGLYCGWIWALDLCAENTQCRCVCFPWAACWGVWIVGRGLRQGGADHSHWGDYVNEKVEVLPQFCSSPWFSLSCSLIPLLFSPLLSLLVLHEWSCFSCTPACLSAWERHEALRPKQNTDKKPWTCHKPACGPGVTQAEKSIFPTL